MALPLWEKLIRVQPRLKKREYVIERSTILEEGSGEEGGSRRRYEKKVLFLQFDLFVHCRFQQEDTNDSLAPSPLLCFALLSALLAGSVRIRLRFFWDAFEWIIKKKKKRTSKLTMTAALGWAGSRPSWGGGGDSPSFLRMIWCLLLGQIRLLGRFQ